MGRPYLKLALSALLLLGGCATTLDVAGMLFANRSTWAHVTESAARLLNRSRNEFLSPAECAAVDGRGEPHDLITPPPAN